MQTKPISLRTLVIIAHVKRTISFCSQAGSVASTSRHGCRHSTCDLVHSEFAKPSAQVTVEGPAGASIASYCLCYGAVSLRCMPVTARSIAHARFPNVGFVLIFWNTTAAFWRHEVPFSCWTLAYIHFIAGEGFAAERRNTVHQPQLRKSVSGQVLQIQLRTTEYIFVSVGLESQRSS